MKKKYLYNIDSNVNLKWRTVIKLSAVFVFMLFISCKKNESKIGANSIDPNQLLNTAQIDTFTLKTYSKFEDSIQTDNPLSSVLGSYNDPKFGTFKAGFFTQLRLPADNPSFGDINSIKIDSFVLGLKYTGFYGGLDEQKYEVHQLTDSLNISTKYYTFSSKSFSNTNLIVPSSANQKPSPYDKIVIDTTHVSSQLRLYIDTNLARTFLIEATNNPSTFSSNDNFLNYFKGIYVSVDNGNQTAGTGGIAYFNLYDPLSKMTIYYHQNGIKKTYDFVINNLCANFNKVEVDNSGKSVENAFENSEAGKAEFYAQSFKSRATISIPGIKNISKKAIIHEALLYLPVEYQTYYKYSPSAEISVLTKLQKSNRLYNIGTAIYQDVTKEYVVDLKSYIQAIISDERFPVVTLSGTYNGLIQGTELYLSPKYFSSSAERIIFNGSKTINKNKPKLILKYTEF